jgi:hypothetical protein
MLLPAVTWRGSVQVAVIWGVLLTIIAAVNHWTFRRLFRRTLARPLPSRGFRRWLVAQPSWLMVLGSLGYALVIVGISASVGVAVLLHHHGGPTAFLFAISPFIVVFGWSEAAAWLELRRRHGAESG